MPRPSLAAALLLSLSLAACGGDDTGATPDAPPVERCAPTPPADWPTTGPLIEPSALPLPAECVVGGLRTAPGRWFVSNPTESFSFGYPAIEGDCDAGFRRANVRADDVDASDGQTYQQWSDGTRLYTRTYYRYPPTGPVEYEYASGFVMCMMPDDSLAALDARYDTDVGEQMTAMTGRRFAVKDAPAAGLSLVGSVATSVAGTPIVAYNVVLDGSHAFVVGPYGLDVVDVTDPAHPAAVGHLDGGFNDVKIGRGAGKVIAFASPLYNGDTAIIDVTDPAAPAALASIPEYSHSVFIATPVATPLLYLATYTDKVPVYDITNPTAPVRLGEATVPGEVAGVHDLFADGDMIYANNTTAGLVAFDVAGGLGTSVEHGHLPTSYSHASWVGTANGRRLVLHGDEGMTGTADGGAFLRVLDGDPASPTFLTEVGRYQTRPEVGIHNFMMVGDKVYIAYYHDGVRVVDLTTAAQPAEVAHYNTWDIATAPGGAFEGALGIRVSGGLIYVADSLKGLLILRED